jgi:hypothetical protein
MGRDRRDPLTGDLFTPVYPVRTPAQIDGATLEIKLCRAISEALKECSESRAIIAARMADYLGEPHFSKAMLDAYASAGRDSHCITVKRFLALIHVTGATWMLDVLAEQFGCYVMGNEDARNAELGLIDKKISELQARRRALKSTSPMKLTRGRS